jgi:hypothetical protein
MQLSISCDKICKYRSILRLWSAACGVARFLLFRNNEIRSETEIKGQKIDITSDAGERALEKIDDLFELLI